jgi:hypothetical protein
MSTKNIRKICLAFASIALAAVFCVSALALDPACSQACGDDLAETYGVCNDTYAEEAAQIEADYQACLESASGFFDRFRCGIQRRGALDQANLRKSTCYSAGEADYARCLVDCETSPSAP